MTASVILRPRCASPRWNETPPVNSPSPTSNEPTPSNVPYYSSKPPRPPKNSPFRGGQMTNPGWSLTMVRVTNWLPMTYPNQQNTRPQGCHVNTLDRPLTMVMVSPRTIAAAPDHDPGGSDSRVEERGGSSPCKPCTARVRNAATETELPGVHAHIAETLT